MTYNPATPNATDLISATQQPIKTNFNQLNVQFAVDHNGYNVGGVNGNGHHKQITFDVALGADPTPATSTSSIIYPKSVHNAPVAAAIQPFFINNLDRPTQLCGDFYTYTPVLAATNRTFNYTSQQGFYYISGGVTFFFGKIITSTETQVNPPGTNFTFTLPSTVVNKGTFTIQLNNATAQAKGVFVDIISSTATVATVAVALTASNAQPETYTFNGFYI